jgi:lambda family phage portal protein
MNLLAKIGTGIDAAISIVSPTAALARTAARERLRKYAAAQTPRTQKGFWGFQDGTVSQEINSSYKNVRSRVRQLVRDFPYFAAAVDNLVAFRVGDGMTFKSQVRDESTPDSGDMDKKTCRMIEEAFKRWSEKADTTGKRSFEELTQLTERQEAECGEYFFLKRVNRKYSGVPVRLQAFENDILTSTGLTLRNNTACDEGVEFDLTDGEILSYWILEQSDPAFGLLGKARRFSANDIVHDFAMLRPNQRRGISGFAPAILIAADMSDYIDSEIDSQKMASKWLAFVTTEDALGAQVNRGATTNASTGKKIESLENATIEYLNRGEDVKISGVTRPVNGLEFFATLTLRIIATTSHIPYEILSADYKGVNYSTLKASRNDFVQVLRPQWGRKIRHFCDPVFRWWMDNAVLSGELKLKNYWGNETHYQASLWIPPGIESVDPLRETKAMIDQIATGVRSPQELIMARGRDPKDVIAELKEWNDLLEAAGVRLGQVSTALKNNPAALDQQGAEETTQEVIA